MRKISLVIAITLAMAFIGTQAFACYWDGYWGGYGCGPMNGFYADNSANYQDFYDDTAQLRQTLAEKRREYHAIMSNENPDPQMITELNQEIRELHDQLSAKARSYGLQTPPNSNYNHGGGYHRGGYGCRW